MKKNSRSNTKQAEIFRLIRQDHELVSGLFKKIEKTTERSAKTREKLYDQLRNELTLHAQAEEKVLYPLLQETKETLSLGFEAEEEHGVMKYLFRKIDGLDPSEHRWTAAIEVLKEVVEQHVEEEEDEMFTQMRKVFDKEQLEQIAIEFRAFKEEAEAGPMQSVKRVVGA